MNATVQVQLEDFDVSDEIDALTAEQGSIGAVATFCGYVRGDDGLTALTLEHYPGMTQREISRIAAEAQKRWSLSGVTIIHRVGRMKVGERIMLVVVAAAHRAAAFEGCEFLMDYLKTRAPFWKQEERGGSNIWVAPKLSDDVAAERWRKS